MPRKQKPPLSELENKVMNFVWEQAEATADSVRRHLEVAQPTKDSTVRTILRRLETKGYVSHRTEGRTYVYRPTVESNSAAADAVRSIIDRFCNGSVEDLLVGMVNREVISPKELELLAKRIAASESNPKPPRRKKSSSKKGN